MDTLRVVAVSSSDMPALSRPNSMALASRHSRLLCSPPLASARLRCDSSRRTRRWSTHLRAVADGERPPQAQAGRGAGAVASRSATLGPAPPSTPPSSSSRSDPRHEKLMQMQKELLEQLEERRKLHAALLESLEDPASTIKAFNQSHTAGLPPLSNPPPTPATSSSPSSSLASPSAPIPIQPPLSPSARAPPPPAAPVAAPSAPASGPAAPAAGFTAPASATPAAAAAAASSRAAPAIKPATSPISVPIPSAPSRQRPSTLAPSPNPASAAPPASRSAPPAAAPSSQPAPAATPAPSPSPLSTPSTSKPASSPALTRAAPSAASAAPPATSIPRPAAAPTVAPPKTVPAPPTSWPAPPPATVPVSVPKPAPQASLPPSQREFEQAQAQAKAQAQAQAQPEPPRQEEPPPPLAGPNVMNICMVASECAPWSKTGGLGDVVGALPKALARRGHRVMVVVPRYSNYAEAVDTSVRKRYNIAGQDMEVCYFHYYKDNVDWVFVDNNEFHHREKNIYGGSREEVTKRMVLLCKAAIEAPWHVPCGGVCYGDGNLVFVANDWHTALLPVYLQAYYRDNGLMQFTRSILVIHNMAHQGRGPVAEFPRLGLPADYINRFKLYDPVGGEHMNIFMAGIISAHRLVAVSHGYAWEVQTQMGGWGLDAVLRDHKGKLRGVVNGIDTQEWSPDCDAFLTHDGYTHYDAGSLEKKALCKAALQRELGLPERPDVALLGFIGRLDYQKGVDIIGEAMPWLTSQNVQLVLLGTGREDLENMLRSFEGAHKDKVRAWVGFSVKMAHRITAGADILLMPSRFEPCGLNQLYAFRYGTVPVVHAVGGLRDTVQPFDPFNDAGLGWTFDKAEANGLIDAVGNALYTFREFKDSWRKLQLRAMGQDLSWDNAAKQYEEVLVEAKYTW